jgi:NAD(P)-dependent dehydrogenase (short-subunit alcohol dehydrogenase family)
MNALVAGGAGGIGTALVEALAQRDQIKCVHASYHRCEPSLVHPKVQWHNTDLTNDQAVGELLASIDAPLNYVVNAAGVLHDAVGRPETAVRRLDPEFFMHNMRVNALPTLLLAKHAEALLKGSEQGVFATVSARVGSIEENSLGGWVSYRSSKAALNMALKTLSIEWRRTLPLIVVAALHPGTTVTPLSAPFRGGVAPDKLFSPSQSAAYMLAVIDKLTPADSGRFWSWDGSELPW